MPSVFITGSNKYGYAVGSTQSVTDTVATQLIGDGNAVLSSTVQLSAKNTSWFADFVNTVQSWVNGVCCLLAGTQTRQQQAGRQQIATSLRAHLWVGVCAFR